MLRKCAAVLTVVLCLANVNAPRAEPGPIGRWLMDEPASLFDLGMLRLEMDAWRWERPHYTYNVQMKAAYGTYPTYTVGYDWDENRIVVRGWMLQNINERTDAESACKKILSHISDMAGVVSDTGKLRHPGMTASRFADYFSHIGYLEAGEPEDYRSRLDQIFVIKGSVVHSEDGQYVACSRRLLSTKVNFEE